MDVLYIPQLDEVDASDSVAARYKILKRTPEDGTVILTDRAVTRIDTSSTDAIRLVVPPLVKGSVRDFFVRLVITSDEIPEITFAAPEGEIISFEDIDETVLSCQIGINVFSFTENDEGVFFVNRKTMDIEHTVEFDSCGGEGAASSVTFKLGAKFTGLPTPIRNGYVFQGWFTAAEGGTQITANDTVKTGITKLYAQWAVYVDPFVDAICAAKNLTFYSSGDLEWCVDSANFHSEPGAARSGPISDSQGSILQTSFTGAGTLSFWWKASSEDYYDKLHLILDGTEVTYISGTYDDWTEYVLNVTGDGLHTVQWKYDKDGSCASGDDCGWVDDVVWTVAGA